MTVKSTPLDVAPQGKPEAPISRREAAKEERRRRILKAARELIRETGETGLSMRALAERAGVSLATPYNLFGSKAAIVVATLEGIKEYQARLARYDFIDPVERLFLAVDLAVEYYLNDPAFHKVVWTAIASADESVRNGIYTHVRTFWRRLALDAVAAGAVAIDAELLYRQLERQYAASVLAWVAGEIEDSLLSAEIQFGFALILMGGAAPDWRGPLQARIRQCEARLIAARAANERAE